MVTKGLFNLITGTIVTKGLFNLGIGMEVTKGFSTSILKKGN